MAEASRECSRDTSVNKLEHKTIIKKITGCKKLGMSFLQPGFISQRLRYVGSIIKVGVHADRCEKKNEHI